MSRGTKQFLYGALYLAVFCFVLFLIFAPKLIPAPSCHDNVQNQGETGVDCGGPCLPCYLKEAKPLEVSGSPSLFKSASLGKVFAVFDVVNRNQDLGMHSFSYAVQFFDGSKNLVGTIDGYDNIFPGESKYLVVEYDGSAYDVGRIASAAFSVTSPASWAKATDFIVPTLSLSQGPTLSSSTGQVAVAGVIKNESPVSAPSVRVVVFVEDKYGDPLFVGSTLVTGVKSFGSSDFSVSFPGEVFAGLDLTGAKAQAYLYAEE